MFIYIYIYVCNKSKKQSFYYKAQNLEWCTDVLELMQMYILSTVHVL